MVKINSNQSFINDTDLINKLREAKINQFSDEIKRQKDLKQNLEIRQDKLAEEADLSFNDLSMQALKQGWDQHTKQVEKSIWLANKNTKLQNLSHLALLSQDFTVCTLI